MKPIIKIAGVIIIFFGLHTIGILPIKWLYMEKRFQTTNVAPGYVGAFVMGLAFVFRLDALYWTDYCRDSRLCCHTRDRGSWNFSFVHLFYGIGNSIYHYGICVECVSKIFSSLQKIYPVGGNCCGSASNLCRYFIVYQQVNPVNRLYAGFLF